MADFSITQDWRTVIDGQLVTLTSVGDTLYDHFTQGVGLHFLSAVDTVDISNTQSWSTVTVYYKMRGMDAVTTGVYDTWVVNANPDFSASSYSGSLNLPLRDVCIIDFWQI